MPSSLNKIYVHAIWSTKHRESLINVGAEKEIFEFMVNEFKENGCQCLIINGTPDHVHCLFKLNLNLALATVIKNIKGSTSHFINQNGVIPEKFAWQKGYGAFSVSISNLDRVYQYIHNQKKHHKIHSLEDEMLELEKFQDGFPND